MKENLDDHEENLEPIPSEVMPPPPPFKSIVAFRGVPVHMTQNTDILDWEDVRPGIGGIAEDCSLLFGYDRGNSHMAGDEDKFLESLKNICSAKKSVLFKNCQKLFVAVRDEGECEFYPANEGKLTRSEKHEFIDRLLGSEGRVWLDLETYAELLCTHAEIPLYEREICEYSKNVGYKVLSFSATGKKLTKPEYTLFLKQVHHIECWVNGSCYDVVVPSIHDSWERVHRILPTGFEFRLRGQKDPVELEVQKEINELLASKNGPLKVYLPYATSDDLGEKVVFSEKKHIKVHAESQDQVTNLIECYEQMGFEGEIKVKGRDENSR